MRGYRTAAFLASICLLGCDVNVEDVLKPETMVEDKGVRAAWFDRPTPATVGFVYVLKMRSPDDKEWYNYGLFEDVVVDGKDQLPALQLKNGVLIIEYESAKIFSFYNKHGSVEIVLEKKPTRKHEKGKGESP